MKEERTKILQMLSEGKISVEDATALLAAAESSTLAESTGMASREQKSADEDYAEIMAASHQGSAREAQASKRAVKLSRANFRGGWTNWANNLDGMICDGANLDGAFLFANNCDSVNFRDVEAENLKVFATNLDSAVFEGANLRGARILCSNLDKANFRNANLEGVLIFASNFDSANMEGADLRGQSFVCTNMDRFNGAASTTLLEAEKEEIIQV